MPPANPFVRAAAEAEAARFALAAADDFARFFAGDLAELQLRWGLTAVEFHDGQWGVVAPGEPMRESDRAVLVYQGGTFAGRKYYRGAEFFKTDVKNVYFAALTLATGEAGAAALRAAREGLVGMWLWEGLYGCSF